MVGAAASWLSRTVRTPSATRPWSRLVPGALLAVLVVDDSEVLRGLVSHYLDGEFDLQVIASVDSAAAAVAHASRSRPDVIVLDHELPGPSGLDVLPELRRLCPGARIVVFSSSLDVRHDVLSRGADEFVSKQRPFPDLVDALRTAR
jgi:DNA-binding NarL/FixJ family response regulator